MEQISTVSESALATPRKRRSYLGDRSNYESIVFATLRNRYEIRGRNSVTFIDYYSRFTRVYLLRNKDEAFDMFLSYKAEVENQFDRKIKRIRSDRGGEYMPLNDYCENEGIIHEVTPPYSPKSNGVAERN